VHIARDALLWAYGGIIAPIWLYFGAIDAILAKGCIEHWSFVIFTILGVF
jgi:hypothetical protein